MKKTSRRIFGIVFSLILLCSLGLTAFAADNTKVHLNTSIEDASNVSDIALSATVDGSPYTAKLDTLDPINGGHWNLNFSNDLSDHTKMVVNSITVTWSDGLSVTVLFSGKECAIGKGTLNVDTDAILRPSHNVTYSYTGTVPSGAPAVPSAATQKVNSTVTVATAPTLEGYTFSGWTTLDATVSGGTFTMPDKDVAFTGSWAVNSHQVTYVYTGTVPAGVPTAPAATNHNYGLTVSVEAEPSFSGYTFHGWSTSDTTVSSGSFTMPDKDVAFTGYWTSNADKVVTYSYTGTIPPGAPTAPSATPQTVGSTVIVAAAPTLEGYTFSGWTTLDATVSSGTFKMPNKDVAFTGSWTVNSHKVTYTYTGTVPAGVPTAPAETTKSYGSTVAVEDVPSFAGYTFHGWATSDTTVSSSNFTMPDKNVAFTGYWTSNNDKVVTYSYTGSVPTGAPLAPDATTPSIGSPVTVASAPTLTGYNFSGWTTTDVTVTEGGFTMPNKNVAFAGSWTPINYTVSYSYSGTIPTGAPSVPATAPAAYNSTVAVATTPSLAGYTFSGWSTADTSVSGGSFTMPNKNVAFTGSWTLNQTPYVPPVIITTPPVNPPVTPPETGIAGEQEKVTPTPTPTPAPTPEASVAGDVEKLPQTGGASTSTILGLAGLALIAIGGTVFVVTRRRNNGSV